MANEGLTRREAIGAVGAGVIAAGAVGAASAAAPEKGRTSMERKPWFRISLAQWSLHRGINAKSMNSMDFATCARGLGIDGIEYVSTFLKDYVHDPKALDELNRRADDAGVKQLLIMVDGEGALGDADEAKRAQAVENHKKWLEAAKHFGCHSIRVNAQSGGSREEQERRAADGLRRLTENAEPYGLNVIVENHGGLSSDGSWLSAVMRRVDHPRCGTLPDFGNFCLDWGRKDDPDAWYDRYKGTAELMPFAKAVSAKSYEFDADGNEVRTDYARMLRIVKDAGYTGWIGVEYEGDQFSEFEGIRKTKVLLERASSELG